MSWRLALSLELLRRQVNDTWPNRSKRSDGTIGDPRHAARKSKHNPDRNGVVRAFDCTHDPDNGADMHLLTEALRASQDPRIHHVIWNRRIFSSVKNPWQWRRYTGANPHTAHAHIDVHDDPNLYDNPNLWPLPGPDEQEEDMVKQGDQGGHVQWWQQRINQWHQWLTDQGVASGGTPLAEDGDYGSGTATRVSNLQRLVGFPDTGDLYAAFQARIIHDLGGRST